MEQSIYTITASNLTQSLNQLNLPAEVESDIANAVNAGKRVTTHQSDITYAGMVVAGYSIEDPETGAGAMMISTGDNGGEIKIPDWLIGILCMIGFLIFMVLAVLMALFLALVVFPVLMVGVILALTTFLAETLIVLGTLAIVWGLSNLGLTPGEIAELFGFFFACMAFFAGIVPAAIFAFIYAICTLIVEFLPRLTSKVWRPAHGGKRTALADNRDTATSNIGTILNGIPSERRNSDSGREKIRAIGESIAEYFGVDSLRTFGADAVLVG